MGNVSLNPKDYREGGGLIDDVNARITRMRFVMTNYGKEGAEMVPVCQMTLTVDDGAEHKELLSVGKASEWAPDEDGTGLNKIGGQSGLVKSSKFGVFCARAVEAGFPESRLGNDVTVFEGIYAHFKREVQDYGDRIKKRKSGDQEFEHTVLVIDKILEDKKGKDAGKKGVAAAVPDEFKEKLTAVIVERLQQNPEGVAKKDIVTAIASTFRGAELKTAMTLFNNKEFLAGSSAWVMDQTGSELLLVQ